MPVPMSPPPSLRSPSSHLQQFAQIPQIPLRRPTLSHNQSGHGSIPVGHARGTSASSSSRHWVVLGKKGRGFRPRTVPQGHQDDDEDDEDDWVTAGLERNIHAQIQSLANALQVAVVPNLALELVHTPSESSASTTAKAMRVRITGEDMWTSLFYHFLYPTSTTPQPLPSFSPLPIAALFELRLLSTTAAGPAQLAERHIAEHEPSRTNEVWKGGVRQLSLLAGRPRVASADGGLHDTVHRWKSSAVPPLSPTVPVPPKAATAPVPALTEEPVNEVSTPPESPYDPASYSYSISSHGPPSPIKTPTSGWDSPPWNVAVSVHMDRRAQGSVCLTPSTATSWGGPSPPLDWDQRSVASYVATPDIGHRAEGSRLCTPSTATTWGAPSPPLEWELRSPIERVQTPDLADRVALTPAGLDGREWQTHPNRYEAMTWLDLEDTDGSSRIHRPRGQDWNSSPPASAELPSDIIPLASPPSSGTRTPAQRSIKIDTSPSASHSLPLSPPRTLDSPERAHPATPVSAGGSLISRRKAAPHPISVPVQKVVLGVVIEKKSLPGLDLTPRPAREHPVISPVVHVVPSSVEHEAPVPKIEVSRRHAGGLPPMPAGAAAIVMETKAGKSGGLVADGRSRARSRTISKRTTDLASVAPLAPKPLPGIRIMLSETVAYPFALGIYPSVRPAQRASKPTTLSSIPIMLRHDIAYPFKNGFYPPVRPVQSLEREAPPAISIMLAKHILYPFADGIYPAVPSVSRSSSSRHAASIGSKPMLVENAMLSGMLEGLDRTKERSQESASGPLFRFGYPYLVESGSVEPTPRSPPVRTPDLLLFPAPASAADRILSRSVVESGLLSGVLNGLDRTKVRDESATVPLFRFGYSYFAEVDSEASTPRPLLLREPTPPFGPIRILQVASTYPITSSQLYPHLSAAQSSKVARPPQASSCAHPIEASGFYFAPVRAPRSAEIRKIKLAAAAAAATASSAYHATVQPAPRSIRILWSSTPTYPLSSRDLYPPPISRSLKIVRSYQTPSYPISSRAHLYPPPVFRSIRILRTSVSVRYPLRTEDLYPAPLWRSLRILKADVSASYPLTSESLYPPPRVRPFWSSLPPPTRIVRPAKVSTIRILLPGSMSTYPVVPYPPKMQPWLSRILRSTRSDEPGNAHAHHPSRRPAVPTSFKRPVVRILLDASSYAYPVTPYPTVLSRSLKILKGKPTYPIGSEQLYPSVKRSSPPSVQLNKATDQEIRGSPVRKAPPPLLVGLPAGSQTTSARRTKTHLMLHLEVVRTLLLSPAASPGPSPKAPSPPQPPQRQPTTVPARTPIVHGRSPSHLPARSSSSAPNFARPISTFSTRETTSPSPAPRLPSSIRNSLRAPNGLAMGRSMSSRSPAGRNGLDPVPEQGLSRSISMSQQSVSPGRVSRPMSRYEGLPSGGPAGGVGTGGVRTAGGLRGRAGSVGGVAGGAGPSATGGVHPPPPGPPPRVPLPSVPGAGRRQSSLVSQRMSQLMGTSGAASRTGPEPSRSLADREAPSRWI